MRIQYFLAFVAILVLSGCGSGTPVATPPPPPTPPPATQMTLAMNPSSVEPGQSATLTWSATNATACTASGAWIGTQQMSGSLNVILSGTKTLSYTLACTGLNGNPTQTAKLSAAMGPNGCTVTPAVVPRADRPMSRRRTLTHRASSK